MYVTKVLNILYNRRISIMIFVYFSNFDQPVDYKITAYREAKKMSVK